LRIGSKPATRLKDKDFSTGEIEERAEGMDPLPSLVQTHRMKTF